jgi:glucoamylase
MERRNVAQDRSSSCITTFKQINAMSSFIQAILCFALAIQPAIGRPDASRVRADSNLLKRSVSSFIATESPIALRDLLCNIGANGCDASGVASGLVVASPDKINPDCKVDLALTH